MGSREFAEWKKFDRVGPIGESGAAWRNANIVATLYNLNRDSRKHPQPFPVSDFLLHFREPTEDAPKGRQESLRKKLEAWKYVQNVHTKSESNRSKRR